MPALLALLACLLAIGAYTDLKSRIIPNWLNLTIAALAPLSWFAAGYAVWPDMAIQLGIGIGLFALFAGLFAMGWMGGGDVKLIGALGLWFSFVPMMRVLILMSLFGGALTLAYWIFHKWKRREGLPEIPYGVAIALAGLSAIGERYLNQFG